MTATGALSGLVPARCRFEALDVEIKLVTERCLGGALTKSPGTVGINKPDRGRARHVEEHDGR